MVRQHAVHGLIFPKRLSNPVVIEGGGIPLPLIISAFERWCQVVQKLQFDWICVFCRQRQINHVLHTGFDRIQAFNLPPSGSFSVFGPVRVLVAGRAGWQMETRPYLYVKSREKGIGTFQLPQSFVDPIFRDKPNHAGTTSRSHFHRRANTPYLCVTCAEKVQKSLCEQDCC